ncbi:MAG: hypothetical protein GC157_07425 [Frankiales bacterium]|nr:hypothetical protein [Frankiales bacterium]
MRLPLTTPSPSRRATTRVPGRPAPWVRRTRRHRRVLAAGLAAVVVWSLAGALRPPPEPSRTVLVAVRDLAAGSVVRADDVAPAARPVPALGPDPVTDTADVVGRVLVTPVLAAEALRRRDVLTASALDAGGAGTVAAPLRVADPGVAALLRTGDTVDVLAATADADGRAVASVVATRVRVLAVPGAAGTPAGGLLGGGGAVTSGDGSLVVVAATPGQALELARAALRGRISLSLHVDG